LFPTPAAVAGAALDRLGLTRARAQALRGFAEAVAGGALDLGAFSGLDDAVAKLTRLPGIGDWTAQYLAMRALGEPDAFPAGDLGVRQALGRGGRLPSEREVRTRAERWRPWRAYAVIALWTEPRPVPGPARTAVPLANRASSRPTRRKAPR
jgi:AraC family transcriptional regulator of adaptative response / DNA-3-methyladenine glycosylase II